MSQATIVKPSLPLPQIRIPVFPDYGLAVSNEDHAFFLLVKRLKEMCSSEFSPNMRYFRHKLQMMAYKQVVEEGYVHKMLDEYMEWLVTGAIQSADAQQYVDEREYYYSNPRLVKDAALRLSHFFALQAETPAFA